MTGQAFILRISPSGVDRVAEALDADQIIIGWANAEGLLDPEIDWKQFRQIVSDTYYSNQETMHKAGAAAGQMWRFIRDMKRGDLVVVPYKSNFYVAEVAGDAEYIQELVSDDTAYRRAVNWLNGKQAIPRSNARAALISRMKTYGTCARATDLIDEIQKCLEDAASGRSPLFQDDLESRLIRETLDELRSGHVDPRGFEELIRIMLLNLGALEAQVIPTISDKGADVVATFRVAGAIEQKVAVQAKHYQPNPPVGKAAVQQVISGIEAEGADLGMVVTCGTFSDEASELAMSYHDEKGIKIELVDGEQFAKLIVEYGVKEK